MDTSTLEGIVRDVEADCHAKLGWGPAAEGAMLIAVSGEHHPVVLDRGYAYDLLAPGKFALSMRHAVVTVLVSHGRATNLDTMAVQRVRVACGFAGEAMVTLTRLEDEECFTVPPEAGVLFEAMKARQTELSGAGRE